MPSNKLIFNPITGAFDTVTDVTDVEQRITNLSASNLGAGSGVFATKVADDFQFKSLVAGQNTKINSSSTQLTLEASSSYIANNNFEFNATGWATYADAAAPAPVDGTGGSPTIVFVRTTNAPLSGAASGYFAKNASGSSQQGQGVSYDFDIDLADRAQVLNIQFDYNTSTNYVDGDIRVYVFARGANEVIEVIDRDLYASSFGKFSGTFQTRSDVSAYRLIFHIASTNTNTYEVMIDNVFVGSKPVVKGPIVTDWISYTPTVTGQGSGSFTTLSGRYRRVGDSIQVRIIAQKDTTAGTGTANVVFTGPFNRDTTKSTSPNANTEKVGVATIDAPNFEAEAAVLGTSDNGFAIADVGINQFIRGDDLLASLRIRMDFEYPVLGFSSNVVLSDDSGNRNIVCEAALTGANQTVTSTAITKIAFATTNFDTTSSFNSSTNEYVVPESGYYDINLSAYLSSLTIDEAYSLYLSVNSVTQVAITQTPSATVDAIQLSKLIYLNKGDSVGGRVQSTADTSYVVNQNPARTFLNIAKRPSPQTVAASEIVAVRATTVTPNAIGTSATIMLYDDKTYDTHNAYNPSTGKFTAPQTGYYQVNASVRTANITLGTTQSILFQIVSDNATENRCLVLGNGAATAGYSAVLSTVVYLSKGQQLDVRAQSSVATTVNTTLAYNVLSIVKLNGVN